jgi:hypothetical protein
VEAGTVVTLELVDADVDGVLGAAGKDVVRLA